uniref:Ig-like domain-containing protein n=1 Tax=Oreochromis aureus TaxID=47969 RepID=A0A668TGM4_OREAU
FNNLIQKTLVTSLCGFTFFICFLCLVTFCGSSGLIFRLFPGEVLVIGSSLPVIAVPGDDVILPCHLEPTFNVQGLTVEWSKPDLKPDPSDRLSRVEYVHLYRDRKEVPDMKMASYFRRTELFMDAMKHGNISLKILNVSEEDNGRYRCFIPKLRSRVKAAVVELVVGEKICFGDVCGSKLKFLLTIYDPYVFLCLLDPNYGKISLTETPLHPRNFQTPDPQDTTQRNGEKKNPDLSLHHFCFGEFFGPFVVTFFHLSRSVQGCCANLHHHRFFTCSHCICCLFLSPSHKRYVRNKQTQTCCCFLCRQTDSLLNFF